MVLPIEKVEKFIDRIRSEGLVEFKNFERLTEEAKDIEQRVITIEEQVDELRKEGHNEVPQRAEGSLEEELEATREEVVDVEQRLQKIIKEVKETDTELKELIEALDEERKKR